MIFLDLSVLAGIFHLYILLLGEFKAFFEKFGKVVSAEVMFNRETHKSRGFGFILFELERSAELVCMEKEHIIDGKVVSAASSDEWWL